jgi:uncharacterized protein YaaW (UPF0174 family)
MSNQYLSIVSESKREFKSFDKKNTRYYNVFKGKYMAKVVTMRIEEGILEQFQKFAKLENRSLSNFIETATMRYIQELEYTDEFETVEIKSNKSLLKRIEKGRKDSDKNRGKL